jgi:hypothetical protein
MGTPSWTQHDTQQEQDEEEEEQEKKKKYIWIRTVIKFQHSNLRHLRNLRP